MLDTQNIKSILVIKLRNIGDVLLTSPVFANLRDHFPAARLCALVNSGTEEMLTDNPVLDQVYVYERSIKNTPFLSRLTKELLFLRKIREQHFDLVINLTEGDRGAVVALASGARYKVGVRANGRGFLGKDRIFSTVVAPLPAGSHTVDRNLALLEAAGIPIGTKEVSFHFPQATRDKIAQRLVDVGLKADGYFHAHVTSRWMFKTMPPVKAARFLDDLAEGSGLPCLLTSSPDAKELAYLDELRRHTGTTLVHFSDLTLKELGAVTAMARFFAGVDSAPMHMAAALGIPVLGVFGPSSVQAWGPWNNAPDRAAYAVDRGVQVNGRHVVLQSGQQCVPCHRDGCKGSKVSDCLNFDTATLQGTAALFLENMRATAEA